MLTVPKLLAIAQRQDFQPGEYACFYCGASCDATYTSTEYVKPSFNGWSTVAAPDSLAVCGGCVLCLNEHADIQMPDGVRADQRMRNYSWVISGQSAMAYTKAHIGALRSICLAPPEPPFAVVISDSGQKQLLYRGVVSLDAAMPTVTLEEERVTYSIAALQGMLSLCGKLIAATGKPALKEPINFNFARAVIERFPADGEALLDEWRRVQSTPLARLAVWLSASKEEQMKAYA